LDPCVYEVFYSELALELNPEVVTLTPGTPCISRVSAHFDLLPASLTIVPVN